MLFFACVAQLARDTILELGSKDHSFFAIKFHLLTAKRFNKSTTNIFSKTFDIKSLTLLLEVLGISNPQWQEKPANLKAVLLLGNTKIDYQ